MSNVVQGVLDEVAVERRRQEDKWGEQNHPSFPHWWDFGHHARMASMQKERVDAAVAAGGLTYKDILMEEFLEALAEEGPTKLRTELIQVAAVAAAWVECIDRRAQEAGA